MQQKNDQAKRIRSSFLASLANYPLTFYFGIVILLGSSLLLYLSATTGWKFDVGLLLAWLSKRQTTILAVTSGLLGLTLIASAIAYRKVSDLTQKEYFLWLQQRATRTLFPIFIPLHDWLRLRFALYRWWHSQVIASSIHIILLIVFGASMTFQVLHLVKQEDILLSPGGSDPACAEEPPIGIGPSLFGISIFKTAKAAGNVKYFTVTGITDPTTAGVARSVTVTAYDCDNLVKTDYTGTVEFTSTDGQATLPSNYTFIGADNGSHTFTNGVTLKTVGEQSVTVNDSVYTATGSQTAITVTVAAISKFSVSGITTPTTAGTARTVTVTAQDAYNNTVTGYAGTIAFTSSDAQATLPSNYTFVGGDNGTHTFTNGVTLKTAGTRSVTATATVGGYTGSQSSITVNAASISKLSVSGITTPTTAGTARTVTVTAQDTYDNTVTSYTGTIAFTSSDGQATLPSNYTFVGGDNGTHTFTNGVTLKTAGTQSVTATATVGGYTGSQTSITVNFASISTLSVSGITTPTTAGTARSVTVTAKDAYSNTVTTYAGTVTFTSSDAQATLPSNYTFVGGDNGSHTFTNGVTLKTAGTRSVTATDTVTGSITGTQSSIVVNAAAVSKLGVSGIISPVTAGSARSIIVTAQDPYDNTVTSFAGTVAFTSTDAQATLPSNYTFVGGDNGTHTFTNGVTLKTAGTRSVTATATVGGYTGSQTNITVNAGSATKLSVAGITTPTTAGTARTVTVTAQDTYDNTAAGYTGTIAFTSSDAQATLPSNYTFVGGDSGTHTFTNGVTLKTAGTQSVTATDTVSASITGTQSGITVNADLVSKFAVSGITTPTTAGTARTATITAQDVYDNTVTSYTGTFAFTSSDAQATLPSNYTFVGGENGTHTFTNGVTLKTAGTQSVTATATVGGYTGSQTGIVVTAGTTALLSVTGITSPTTAGDLRSVTVTAKDNYNNTTSGYTGTITFTSSDAQATLPSNYTFVGGDNGSHTFTNGVTLKTAGTQSVTATDTLAGGITGAQTGINVVGGEATQFVVSGIVSPTVAGTLRTVIVTAKDEFNNTDTNFVGTIRFTSTDPQAALPANYTFVGGDNGTRTFTNGVNLKTVGSQTVTAESEETGVDGSQASINVTPAEGASIQLIALSSSTTAGDTFPVTALVKDAYGNTATGYTGTVIFSSNDSAASLPSSYTFTGGDAGVHAFSSGIVLRTAGSRTLTLAELADSETANSIQPVELPITVNPGVIQSITLIPESTAVLLGQNFSATVRVFDGYGNSATNFTGTIYFGASSKTAVLPGEYTFTGSDNGVHTFTNAYRFNVAIVEKLTVSTQPTGKPTTAVEITVLAAATSPVIDHYIVTAQSPQTVGVGWSETIVAVDNQGAVVTTDSTTEVTMTSSLPTVSFFADNSFAVPVTKYVLQEGRAAVFAKGTEAGETVLTAIDANEKTGSSAAIRIQSVVTGPGEEEDPPVTSEDEPVTSPGILPILRDNPVLNTVASVTANVSTGLALVSLAPTGAAIVTIITTNLIQGVSLFNLSWVGLFGRRRRRKEWGVVRNGLTHLPLGGVFVELYDGAGQLVSKVLTDKSGKFAFIVERPDSYRIRINNPLYRPYLSESLAIRNADQEILKSTISLEPIREIVAGRIKRVAVLVRILEFLALLNWPLLVVGSVSAVAVLYNAPTVGRYAIVSVYLVLWVVKLREVHARRVFGTIQDSADNSLQPNAVVQLTKEDLNGSQVVRSTITDSRGRFLFLAQPSVYQVVAAKGGYKPKETTVEGEAIDIDIKLERL
jgi:hypothetical protein